MGLQTQMMWDLEEEEIEEEDGFDVQEWEKHREFRLACRGLSTILVQQVHLQELKTRKETLTRRVREQVRRRFSGTSLLLHGTHHIDAILADGWLAGGSNPGVYQEAVCFSRLPETAAYFAFGWREQRAAFEGRKQQDALHPAAVLIFDRDKLRERYRIRPCKPMTIWYRDNIDWETFKMRWLDVPSEERISAPRFS